MDFRFDAVPTAVAHTESRRRRPWSSTSSSASSLSDDESLPPVRRAHTDKASTLASLRTSFRAKTLREPPPLRFAGRRGSDSDAVKRRSHGRSATIQHMGAQTERARRLHTSKESAWGSENTSNSSLRTTSTTASSLRTPRSSQAGQTEEDISGGFGHATPRQRLSVGSRLPPLSGVQGMRRPSVCFNGGSQGIRRLGLEETIFDIFSWNEVLQESGDGGKVVICSLKPDESPEAATMADTTYVMKMRSKQSLRCVDCEAQFRRIHKIMLNFPEHPNVMPIHAVLEDDKFYYVVMKQASEGAFLESLVKDYPTGVIPSSVVKSSMRDILEAVGHLHSLGILHRDIKPDNVVVDRDATTGETRAILVDFDHADACGERQVKSEYSFGTTRFSAPETFLAYYSKQSDLYSIGVTFYLLMAGRMPYSDEFFWTHNDQRIPSKQTYAEMKAASIDWSCSPWPQRPACRDFCRRLLAFHPGMRFESCEHALHHRWFFEVDDTVE